MDDGPVVAKNCLKNCHFKQPLIFKFLVLFINFVAPLSVNEHTGFNNGSGRGPDRVGQVLDPCQIDSLGPSLFKKLFKKLFLSHLLNVPRDGGFKVFFFYYYFFLFRKGQLNKQCTQNGRTSLLSRAAHT